MTDQLRPASDAFLDSALEAANALRFMRFCERADAEIRLYDSPHRLVAETEQATLEIVIAPEGVVVSIKPGPTGPEFAATSILLSDVDFRDAPFMRAARADSPDLHKVHALLAAGYSPIDSGGEIRAFAHGHEFAVFSEAGDEASAAIDQHVNALARGIDAVAATHNHSFSVHLLSPALAQKGSIDVASYEGRVFALPRGPHPDESLVQIATRMRLLQRFADERPDALMIDLRDAAPAQWRLRPLGFTYQLPHGARDAREAADAAFAALSSIPTPT